MNKIKCGECKCGIPVDPNERVLLCDNPDLKTYGKNVKHGMNFSCGYGIPWNQPEVPKIRTPIEVPPARVRVGFSSMIAISQEVLG